MSLFSRTCLMGAPLPPLPPLYILLRIPSLGVMSMHVVIAVFSVSLGVIQCLEGPGYGNGRWIFMLEPCKLPYPSASLKMEVRHALTSSVSLPSRQISMKSMFAGSASLWSSRPKEVVTGHLLEVMSCAQKPSATHRGPSKQLSCSSLAPQRRNHKRSTLSPSQGVSPSREVFRQDWRWPRFLDA